MTEAFTYIRTGASGDLAFFADQLLAILNGENPDLRWRTEAMQQHYLNFRESLGEEGVAEHLRGRMQGHTMALLENDFPYDALMPLGGERLHAGGGLVHFCLWSTDPGLLTPENIDLVVDTNFFGLPVLVFQHEDRHKTVQSLAHAHIIVDLGMEKNILMQRFFEPDDFLVQ